MAKPAKPEGKRYRSPSRSQYVEFSLSEFGDEEIKAEFAHRFDCALGAALDPEDAVAVSRDRLQEVRAMQLAGRHSEAARACADLIRDALGTAI